MFSYEFQGQTLIDTKDMFIKICIRYLIDYVYHNMTTAVYKVIGSVIYLFIDNVTFNKYLGILQHMVSAYNNKF